MDSTGAINAQELCESTDSNKSDPYALFEKPRADQELSSSDSSGKSKISEGSSVGYATITSINVAEVTPGEIKSDDSKHNESGQNNNQRFIEHVEDSESSTNNGSSTINESFNDSGPFETDISTADIPIFTVTKGRHKFYQNLKTGKDVCWKDSTTWPGFKHRCGLNEIVDLPLPSPNPEHNVVELQPPDEVPIADLPLPFPTPEHNAVVLQPPVEVPIIHEDPGWQPLYNIFIRIFSAKKQLTVIGCIFVCIVGTCVFITKFKYLLDFEILNDPPFTIALHTPDKCEKDIPITMIGQRICIPYTQQFTSDPSFIHVRQLSTQYLRAPKVFSFNVSSTSFVQQNGVWIVSFNSSRPDQQFRFVQEKATCDNIGNNEITIEFTNGNVTSFESEIILEEPKLNLNVSRINDSIHVHCEMTNNCKTVSLGLIVNNKESSRLIHAMNESSYNEKKNSSTITADAIIPAALFSGNLTISCVPLMTDYKLAANLTSTMGIPVCEGDDPQLEQRVTRLNDKVFVHCEMKKTCMASSLALFVNDKGSSRLIPDIDVCSFTDKNSGTTVSANAIIHVSQLSEYQTISCVPLMTNMELAANLTSTSGIPTCQGDCVPDCKDNPQEAAYFPDKSDCTQFYQCSNGQLVSQSCSPSTYWSTKKCTCLHFDDDICNRDTNRFLSPLLSIEKCTNASLA